jgi:hypothetical protein
MTVATLVARNANDAMVGSDGVCVWRVSEAWNQAVGLVLVHWQESVFSRGQDVFAFNLQRKGIL